MNIQNEEESFKILEILKTRAELIEKSDELYGTVSNDELKKLWGTVYDFTFKTIYKTKQTKIKTDARYENVLCLMAGGLGWRSESHYGQPYTHRVTNIGEQVKAVFEYGKDLIPYFNEKDRTSIKELVKWVTKHYELISRILENDNPIPKTVMEIDKEILTAFGHKSTISKIKYEDGRGCDYEDVRIYGDKIISENSNSWRSESKKNPKVSVNSKSLGDSYLYFVLRKEISEFFDKCKEELSVLRKEIDLAVNEFKETFSTVFILNAL